MPRGKSSQFNLVSRFGQVTQLPDEFDQEASSGDAMIKQETYDRKVKHEASERPNLNNFVKHEDQGDKKPRRATIKQEGRDLKKRTLNDLSGAQAQYNWDVERDRATAKASRLGLKELPANEVAQVIEHGTLTKIFHANWQYEQLDSFFHYDGLEVLARVLNYDMQAAVCDLAAIHIGERLGWSHPDDHDLQVSSVQMKGMNSRAYAVKVSPPKDYLAGAVQTKKMRGGRARYD